MLNLLGPDAVRKRWGDSDSVRGVDGHCCSAITFTDSLLNSIMG